MMMIEIIDWNDDGDNADDHGDWDDHGDIQFFLHYLCIILTYE